MRAVDKIRNIPEHEKIKKKKKENKKNEIYIFLNK